MSALVPSRIVRLVVSIREDKKKWTEADTIYDPLEMHLMATLKPSDMCARLFCATVNGTDACAYGKSTFHARDAYSCAQWE